MGCFDRKLRFAALAALLLTPLAPATLLAQTPKEQGRKEPAKKDAPAKPPPGLTGLPVAEARPPLPTTVQMTLLVQNTMAAVGQANKTGNYTVLHALGTQSFQQVNSPAQLGQIFANLHSAKIDISPVILHQPVLTAQPAIDEKGQLRLTGYYDTKPQNVLFDTLFVIERGEWRMHGVSIKMRPAQPPPGAAPQK